ncbi:MAG: hypothetical protein KJ697_02630 [Nanoarchaeota archaeon]|nr:hypothetical protein [Nanoarchaeota archaeon]MBU4124449.1 hypothetical protein [Nanoarchaeota archaeon]
MKKLIIFTLILSIIFISGCVQEQIGTYDYNYYGTEMKFNSNLDEAVKINVYPDNETLKNTLFGYNVVGVQFAYYENDTEAPYYAKSLISFTSKYQKINTVRWNYDIGSKITVTMLNSIDQLLNTTIEEPAILLLGSAFTDETKIVVEGNVVKVYAKNLELRSGKYAGYTDFDLALDKILLVLMEPIEV